MTTNIVLVGGANSGKSNYIARLWLSLSKDEGRLRALKTPDKIEYVEKLVEHLLAGQFAPRSDSSLHEPGNDLIVDVTVRDASPEVSASLVVPDVLGEVWRRAVEDSELSQQWYDLLKTSTTALLFVRAHSEDTFEPLDWVTAGELLADGLGDERTANQIPTQVAMCELLRMLDELLLKDGSKPRVAIVVAAWDKLDRHERKAPPTAYIEKQFPLLAGRLQDMQGVEVRVFGLSVVGGDLSQDAFRKDVLETGVSGKGYVVYECDGTVRQDGDVTAPIQWLLDADSGK